MMQNWIKQLIHIIKEIADLEEDHENLFQTYIQYSYFTDFVFYRNFQQRHVG